MQLDYAGQVMSRSPVTSQVSKELHPRSRELAACCTLTETVCCATAFEPDLDGLCFSLFKSNPLFILTFTFFDHAPCSY